jgi:hypothetical protein
MGFLTVIFARNLLKTWHNVHISSMTYVLLWHHACRVYMVMYVLHYGGDGGNNNTNCQNYVQLEET